MPAPNGYGAKNDRDRICYVNIVGVSRFFHSSNREDRKEEAMNQGTAIAIIVASTVLTQVGLVIVYKRWCDKLH